MSDSSHDRRLDEAIAAYEEGGADVAARAALLARYPELAPALQEYFSNHDFAARMGASLRVAFGTLPLAFGRYQLTEVIGRGGMGVVFKARDTQLKRVVALKTIDRPLASALDLARFQVEAETAASLHHPNIVPVYDVGVHEGQPYYTMALVEGPSLAADLPRLLGRPGDAADFLARVADAIHDAHKAGILHRDLKPANILLDAAGNPLITDFGLAKKIVQDNGAPLTSEGDVFGTAEYMAPEQAAGQPGKVGIASDVYSLGVILYLLLTGRHPVAGPTRSETLRLIATAEPPPPRTPDGRPVDADLAAICLRCLEKEPAARYADAGALAADLRRWLAGDPVAARRASPARRLWRLVRRHPSRALALTLAVGLAGSWVALVAARAGRRQEILESNLYVARQVGRELLQRLEGWAALVAGAASDPELGALLADWRSLAPPARGGHDAFVALPEQQRLQAFCARLHRSKPAALENWYVLDPDGDIVARTPRHQVIGRNFRDRDYFAGALAHRGRAGLASVHVSRVYRSEADGLYKFDLSAPVLDARGGLLGVIAVSATTGPDMGLPHLHDHRRKAVLLAPADASSGGAAYVVLLHPAYAPGVPAVELARPVVPVAFPRRCDDELGAAPLGRAVARRLSYGTGPAFTGHWLAGLAPVGSTGLLVIIQQPDL